MANEAEPRTTGAITCNGSLNLLDDEPTGQDELGPHEALARVIERMVEVGVGGKAIAIEGTWGSGKSTVVRLLKRRLENRKLGRIFVFDGWAHEGDPLRRALIEEFAGWIEREGLPGNSQREWKKLKDEVENLTRRRIEETVAAKLALTSWGRAMAVVLAALPAGAVLAGKFKGYLFLLGLAITAFPLLLLGAAGMWVLLRTFTYEKLPASIDDVLGIFLRETEKHTTVRGWSTVEPTSIEFIRTFRSLLGFALHRTEGADRLLVVLDNVDRLPGKEAVRAFATLRGIFEQGPGGDSWKDRFWLVVPYDPRTLRSAPENLGADESVLASETEALGLWPVSERAAEDSFRHKFFQARLRLAPPVGLRWREFLKNRLKAALPGHDGTLITGVCDLFELVRDGTRGTAQIKSIPGRSDSPTPREIKIFVNRLAALHMQWPCKTSAADDGDTRGEGNKPAEPIPLILQAGFALCESRVCNGRLCEYVPGFGGSEFFTQEELRLLLADGASANPTAAEWERHVAAMWFGVPQQTAVHMLLWPKIRWAYQYGISGEGLGNGGVPYESLLPSLSIGGFWEVARAAARVSIGKPDQGAPERCAGVLAVLGKWGDDSLGWRESWRQIEEDVIATLDNLTSALNNSFWAPCGENFVAAIAVPESSDQLAESILNTFERVPSGTGEGYFQSWARATAMIMDVMMTRGCGSRVCAFQVPAQPHAFISLLAAAQSFNGLTEPSRKWVPPAGPQGIMDEVNRALMGPKPSLEHAVFLRWLAQAHPDWPWGNVVVSILTRFRNMKDEPRVRKEMSESIASIVGQWQQGSQHDALKSLRDNRPLIENAMNSLSAAEPNITQEAKNAASDAAYKLQWILDILTSS